MTVDPYDLKSLPTKVLMKYLKQAQATRSKGFSPTGSGRRISLRDIKKELSKREHVPNKAEAKEMRQDKARLGNAYRDKARRKRRRNLKKRRGY